MARQQGLTEERIQAALRDVDGAEFSDRERSALHFAEDMVLRRTALDADRYQALLNVFSAQELVELGVFTSLCIGFESFVSTLGLDADSSCVKPIFRTPKLKGAF